MLLPLSVPVTIAQVQPSPRICLADILPQARWNITQQGPLIVVGAEKLFARKQVPIPSGANFSQSLPSFGRKLVRCGRVWVVAPERIPGYPDIRGLTPEAMAARSQQQAFVNFLLALDEAHWKKMGQGNGLGREDLPPKAQALFDALLPEGIAVEVLAGSEPPDFVPLTAGQRAGVRLNLRWAGSWDLPPLDSDDTDMVPVQDAYSVIPNSSGGDSDTDYSLEYRNTRQARLTRTEVPNRGAKVGDLNLDALEQPLSLEGIRTIRELIVRAGRATGLELYADARVEKLSLTILGRQARTGDALKALCCALGGTFRRVGNTYLLAENQQTEALLMRDILERDRRAWALQENEAQRLQRHLIKNAPRFRAAITPLPGEPHPQQLAKLATNKPDPEWTVDTAQLPENLQQHAKELAAAFAKKVDEGDEQTTPQNHRVTRVRVDRARITPEVACWAEIPFAPHLQLPFGYGHLFEKGLLKDAWPSSVEPREPPAPFPAEWNRPVIWPATCKKRAVRISPDSAEDAGKLAAAAKRAGLTDIWVEVPANLAQAKPLLQAAAKSGLAVIAVIRPLVRPAFSEGDGFLSDLLPTGETTDGESFRQNHALPEGVDVDVQAPRYLFPSQETIEPLVELAHLSCVDGIVLEEVDVLRGGCLPSMRQAFVRRYHTDPCDLVTTLRYQDGQKAPFERLDDLEATWREFRKEQVQRWQTMLGQRLLPILGKKPLWAAVGPWDSKEFQHWTDPGRVPLPGKPYLETVVIEKGYAPTQTRALLNVWANVWMKDKKPGYLLITLPDADTDTLVKYLLGI